MRKLVCIFGMMGILCNANADNNIYVSNYGIEIPKSGGFTTDILSYQCDNGDWVINNQGYYLINKVGCMKLRARLFKEGSLNIITSPVNTFADSLRYECSSDMMYGVAFESDFTLRVKLSHCKYGVEYKAIQDNG